MPEKLKVVQVFKDKEPKIVNPVKEEVTKDSTLELNPEIKDKNFFEDPNVVDFLLDSTK